MKKEIWKEEKDEYHHTDEQGVEDLISAVKIELRKEKWTFFTCGDAFVFGWKHKDGKDIYVCRIERELEVDYEKC